MGRLTGKYGPGFTVHMYFIHIFPAVACFLNSLSTNVILRASYWKAIVPVSAFYFSMLGIFTIKTGIVIYGFVDFKTW